jgi:hypothetical protein
VIFNDPYNGVKYIYVDGYDNNGVNSGLYCPNSAFVVNSTDYAPESISVSPGSGSAPAGQIQTFQVKIHDVNGVQTMWHLEFMFTSQQGGWQYGYAFQPTQRCKVVAEASANLIWVEDDVENGMAPPGFANFGASSPASISSNRCTLYPSMSSQIYTDIDTEVITFAVSFAPTFTGAMYDHMYIVDNLGMDHWDNQSDGTWSWEIASPMVTGMSPAQGLVGDCTNTNYGSGLSGNPQVSSDDPYISFTLNSFTDSQLNVTFCIDPTDTDGNANLNITSFGQQYIPLQQPKPIISKQIPKSLSLISAAVLPYTDPLAAQCPPSLYGFPAKIVYQVLDGSGKPIRSSNMLPVEKLTQYIVNFVLQGDVEPNWFNFTRGAKTDQNGTFADVPFGNCATGQFIASDIQQIAMQIGIQTWPVRTNNWQYRSQAPGTGSTTNNADITVTK